MAEAAETATATLYYIMYAIVFFYVRNKPRLLNKDKDNNNKLVGVQI